MVWEAGGVGDSQVYIYTWFCISSARTGCSHKARTHVWDNNDTRTTSGTIVEGLLFHHATHKIALL